MAYYGANTTLPSLHPAGVQSDLGLIMTPNQVNASTTLTGSNAAYTVCNPTTNITVKLDSSHTTRPLYFVNQSSTSTVKLVANDNSTIRTVYPGTTGQVLALQTTPTTNTHWEGIGIVQSLWTLDTTGTVVGSPNPTFGSGGGVTFRWRRNGANADLLANVDTGAAGAALGGGEYMVVIPTALSIDYTQLPATTGQNQIVGRALFTSGTGGPVGDVFILGQAGYTNNLRIANNNGTATWNATNNPFTTQYRFQIFASVPVTGWTTTKG